MDKSKLIPLEDDFKILHNENIRLTNEVAELKKQCDVYAKEVREVKRMLDALPKGRIEKIVKTEETHYEYPSDRCGRDD